MGMAVPLRVNLNKDGNASSFNVQQNAETKFL